MAAANENAMPAGPRTSALSLNYLTPGDGPKRPGILTAIGVLSIGIGFSAAAVSGLALWFQLVPDLEFAWDAPFPIDLYMPYDLALGLTLLTAIWLFLAGIRVFASRGTGIFSACRMHRVYVVAGLVLACAWTAIQIASDIDVAGNVTAAEWVPDGLLWLLVTAAYPATLIPILRSNTVARYCTPT